MGRLLLSRVFVPFVAILCGTFFFLRPAGIDGPMPEPVAQTGKGFDHQPWSNILLKIRKPNGRIDFAAVRENEVNLQTYLGALRAACPRSTPHRFRDRDSRLAYYLNAYNAIALSILSNHCPMKTPSELYWADGVYWRLGVMLGELRTTLTTLESERLEPLILRDPRVRFAVFRGTVDAPLLQTKAFEPETLDDQLDELTASALKLSEFVRRTENEVRLNALFFWHKQEFGDFQTWFKTQGLDFEDEVQFVVDDYDDALVEYENSCSGFVR